MIWPRNPFRDVPTRRRTADPGEGFQVPEQFQVVLEGLAEADPRVDRDPVPGDPAGLGLVNPAGEVQDGPRRTTSS